MLNKIFAFILFVTGLGFLVVGACGNLAFNEYILPNATLLTTWGIIWRIGLGLLLIAIAVLLNNLESGSKAFGPVD